MWNYSYWTENFNKRICKYLIQRYLGQYLQEKLTLDQLTIDISSGTGNVRDVSLDCCALNVLAEEQALPIEFIEGHLECISLSIPWKTLMQDSCEIEVSGMTITIQPKKRRATNSVFDSMWTSMASSIQLAAADFLQTVDDDSVSSSPPQEGVNPIPGLEQCAQAIDAVFARGKVCFRNTTIRVQHLFPKGDTFGVAVELRIKLLSYADEIAEPTETQRNYSTAYSEKKLILDGLSCYTDVFQLNFHSPCQTTRNGDDSESGSSEEEDVLQPVEDNTTVQCAKFAGRHTVKIRIKEDDTIAGPQFIVECNFGSLIAFLSPLQVHILMKLMDEFINPETTPSSKEAWLKAVKEKPMDTFDFRRVEEELQEQIKPAGIGLPGLQRQQGWSSGTFDDSDDEFLPFKSKSGMFSSVHSTIMNMSSTSVASSTGESESIYSASTSKLNGSPSDSQKSRGLSVSQAPYNTEKTVSVSMASVIVILLHDDHIDISKSIHAGSSDELQKLADDFFRKVGLFSVASGKRNVDGMRETLNSSCSSNHLRLTAAPVKVSATTLTEPVVLTNGYVALGHVELIEFLGDKSSTTGPISNNCIQVVTFPNQLEFTSVEAVRIEFKYKAYSERATKTTLKVHLQPCLVEVDISLIDRINALLVPKLFDYAQQTNSEFGKTNNTGSQNTSQNVVMVKVDTDSAVVNFRFPIPDLRPPGEFGKTAYWVRNIRSDSIILKLKGIKFSTTINSTVQVLELDTVSEEVKLFYKESEEDEPIFIGEATSFDDDLESLQMTRKGFDWPRVVVWIYPEKMSPSSVVPATTDETDPLDAFLPQNPKETSPFTSRRVVHECTTSSGNNSDTDNESVIPGDRSEMNRFIETASRDVIYKVEMNLRCVTVSLPSKHIFEEIYNRFGTDLLLWEPSAPKRSPNGLKENMFHEFKTMLNRHRTDDQSGSEDEEEISAFYTPSQPNSLFKKSVQRRPQTGQSQVTINIAIEKGVCSFYAPFTNTTGGVVPEQKGQFSITVDEGNVFVVSGYNGNATLGYVCVFAKEAELYHLDLMRGGDASPRFGQHVKRTIYRSADSVLSATSHLPALDYSDMLSVAIKIERDAAKNVKTFKVAVSVKDGTLNHTVWLPNRSWFTQLVDFFDVLDTPVLGYTPAVVVTELHLHLWNCAIDYAPLNLPLRVIVAIENFALSSNIVAQKNMSVISFLAEQTALFLTTNRNSVDLKTDYVCVLDMDLFELSLRLCQNRASTAPRIELTASNNVLHIRTCSDSFKHILDLITYYANDGDLSDPQSGSDLGSRDCTPIPEDVNFEPALIDTAECMDTVNRITISQTEQLHELVADAMTETNLERSSSSRSLDNDPRFGGNNFGTVELHFETNGHEESDMSRIPGRTQLPTYYDPIMQSSDGLPVDINPDDDDYEEFCILEDDPGVGILKSNGEPVARALTDEPIRMIDNYFSVPIGRTDVLKAPRHYPNAVMRYSIKDVGIVWHLYGGEDFVSPTKAKSPKRNSVDSGKVPDFDLGEIDIGFDALNSGVVFSKTRAFEHAREAFESPTSQRAASSFENLRHWRNKGGKGRRHDVCVELHLAKMKFQHETYPEHTEQASRQVLVIHTMEIHDRLQSSNYNKMLYLFSSPSKPKQSHANMVVIKAAHIRPDAQLNIEECCLKVSLLPLRLNVDQDSLLFLHQFFGDIAPKSDTEGEEERSKPQSHHSSLENLPVMTVRNSTEEDLNRRQTLDPGNLLIFDESPVQDDNVSISSRDQSIDSVKTAYPIYFRQVIFSPEVPIRIDYTGKRLDMTHGPLAGFLMCLAQLNNSEIHLKTLNYRNGILGVDRLFLFMVTEWGIDIKKNQLPSLLGGIGPLYSFVQIFQGIRDLFWLPIEQYQKDGRITKGIQRGATSFSTSTAMAALELTNRLVQTIQSAAEFTYDMVSPGPSMQQQRQLSKRKKRMEKPGDIRSGVTNAYLVLKDGFGDTAKTIVRVATKEHEQKGLSGAFGGVLRQIAPTVCVPIILSSQATSSLLDGFKSQLEPDSKKDAAEKWKQF